MNEALVQIESLCKTFNSHGAEVRAVDDVSLTIQRGEVLGLVGESGSGKSTLGRLLIGLHDKDSGKVVVDDVLQRRRYRRADFRRQASRVQMIFQDPDSSLNPRLTVREILREPIRLLRLKGDPAARIQQWLERVNLPLSVLDRYAHELSGGQKQRIGIARALIAEPQLLICDEPISALDVSVQAQVVNLLRGLQSELGLTMLFIAHDLAMVRYISDRIAVMYRGQLMELGQSDTLVAAPRHPYSQLLLASSPVADPNVAMPAVTAPVVQGSTGKANVRAGCQFADRCPHVMDQCRQQRPMLRQLPDSEQLAACYWLEERV